jgi:hypothetical protein
MHPEGLTEQSLSNLLKAAPAIRNPAAIQVTALLQRDGTLSPSHEGRPLGRGGSGAGRLVCPGSTELGKALTPTTEGSLPPRLRRPAVMIETLFW